MTLPVVLSLEAASEFDAAVDWYQQRTGRGAEFAARVREVLDLIGQSPEMHRVVFINVRGVRVQRFPYRVYYRVQSDRIEVIAIFHGRRNPADWQRRV